MSDSDIAEEFINSGSGISFKGKRISSLLEFGRIVHAELAALMDAARRGVPVGGHSLYCTTFPCHMCARHIISSGLKKVFYIEPYPKSLAKELYDREICVDNDNSSLPDAVRFVPFVGIAPKRYMSWFEFGKRKDERGFAVPAQTNLTKRKVVVSDVDRSLEEFVLVDEFLVKMGAGQWNRQRKSAARSGLPRRSRQPSKKVRRSRPKNAR